jgi:hypothetical protein
MTYGKLKKIALNITLLSFLAIPIYANQKISHEKIAYIKTKYEHIMFGKEHLFYPARKAKRLLIIFNGTVKNKYSMFSWFWNDKEKWQNTSYLFLKDDTTCWYLGNNEISLIEDFSHIISHYITACKLTKDKVFTIGSSMGAYGALFYATILELGGVIALNPQVNKVSNEVTRYSISNTGSRWQDLDKVIAAHTKAPNISLIFSHNPQDQAAGYALLEKSCVIMIKRKSSHKHAIAPLVFSKEFIEREIDYLEKQALDKDVIDTDVDRNITDTNVDDMLS